MGATLTICTMAAAPAPAPTARRRLLPGALSAAVALAAAVATAASTARPGAAATFGKPMTVRVMDVLDAPGSVLTLPDGRQLRARRVAVGGCATAPATVKRLAVLRVAAAPEEELATTERESTTAAEGDSTASTKSESTAMTKSESAAPTKSDSASMEKESAATPQSSSATPAPSKQQATSPSEASTASPKPAPAPASSAEGDCLVGAGEPATYHSFEGIVVEANGFRFTASVVLTDIDAEAGATPSSGWAETMSTVGRAGEAVVVPTLTTVVGSGVGLKTFTLPSEAMGELGWMAAEARVAGAVANPSMKSACWEGDRRGRRGGVADRSRLSVGNHEDGSVGLCTGGVWPAVREDRAVGWRGRPVTDLL